MLGAFALGGGQAEARKPDIKRKGGQMSGVIGGSLCVPGAVKCFGDDQLPGRTRPSFGMAFDAGYRINKFFFIGAGYQLGLFDPTYNLDGEKFYTSGIQNSVLAVPRFYLPFWRFDLGIAYGLGFSRQSFPGGDAVGAADKTYTQGFAMRPELSLDVWVTKRVFIGARANIVLNAHRDTCVVEGSNTTCERKSRSAVAGVHQSLIGLHIGGTFF